MTRFLLLALMCENVNAAPIEKGGARAAELSSASDAVAGAAHPNNAAFTIAHPMCQTGFTIAQRFDERNSSGAIIKSVWVRKCVRAPKLTWRSK